MPRTCIFTITTGRSGTAFLTELLRANVPGAEVHHEILQYDAFGVHTPDISDLMQFNAFGTTPKVRAFSAQKLQRIANSPANVYAETSHLLAKAGLFENLADFVDGRQVYVILLRREIVKIVASLQSRFDMLNVGSMWLWYLDPDYPNRVVDSTQFKQWGWTGICLWYVYEMLTRAEYYRLLLANVPGIRFIDVELDQLNDREHVSEFLAQCNCFRSLDQITIPPPQNMQSPRELAPHELDSIRELVGRIRFVPAELAKEYIRLGKRVDQLSPTASAPHAI